MVKVSTADVARAAERAQAYGFFAAALEFPEGELTELIRKGMIAQRARALLCAIYPELAGETDWEALGSAGSDDELSIEYTRLFNLPSPGGGQLCPLNSRLYDEAPMKTLEGLVRFYNFFGLTSAETRANELPDHLTTQFEFLHFLCCQEACSEAEGAETVADYRLAQRDFLEHHPGRWVPMLAVRLREHDAHPLYRALGDLLDRFIRLDRRHVGNLANRATAH